MVALLNLLKVPMTEQKATNLVSGHAILFHLLKFALELVLALPFLLCAAHIHLPAIHFLAIHVVNGLQ